MRAPKDIFEVNIIEMQEISNRSDFIIKTKILDNDSLPIPYLEVDWAIYYYTYDRVVLHVACEGGILTPNCNIVDNIIEIYVNKFDWGRTGQVKRKVHVSFVDNRFADGRVDVTTPEEVTKFKIV